MSAVHILAAFVRRDWRVARSYRATYVMGLISTAFSLTLYFSIGRLVDHSEVVSSPSIREHGYFAFVAAGMIVLNMGTYALTSFSGSVRGEQITGALEALLVTPVPFALLLFGITIYGWIQIAISTVVLFGLATFVFGFDFDIGLWSGLQAIAALIGTIIFFTAIGIAAAGLTVIFKRANSFLILLTSGVGVLTGVYYPVTVLPDPLPALAGMLPITWGVTAWRDALLTGQTDILRLALLFVAGVAALPVAIWFLDVSVNHARREGSLGQH